MIKSVLIVIATAVLLNMSGLLIGIQPLYIVIVCGVVATSIGLLEDW